MRTVRLSRGERRIARKHSLANLGREFASDLIMIIDERQEQLFHLLSSESYFLNKETITYVVIDCAIRRTTASLSRVSHGKELLRASNEHVRMLLALRCEKSANDLRKTWHLDLRSPAALMFPTINSSFLDFASKILRVAQAYDLDFWSSFARQLCVDVDKLVLTYSLAFRRI